jgi:hypothetical protein
VASCLKEDIEKALRHPRGKLHEIFVDYTKALHLINRTLLLEKLERKKNRQELYHKTSQKYIGEKCYPDRRHYSQITTLTRDERGIPRRPSLLAIVIIATADITKAL